MPATRSYPCNDCIETFTTPSARKTHMKTTHGKPGKYACKYCGAILSDPSVKSRHITERHTERPRLSCTKCPYRTKRPGDLRKHCLKHHDEAIVIPRRSRRTDAEIVVKPPVVTQFLDNYNPDPVTFAPPVMIAPTFVEFARQDRFAEVPAFQTSYQTTPRDIFSLDWLNPRLDSSPSPSPISTSVSTPSDSTSSNHPDWFMGALGMSKSPSLAHSDPLSALHYSGEWETFTFGI